MPSRRLLATLGCGLLVAGALVLSAQTDNIEASNAAPVMHGPQQLAGRNIAATVPVRAFSWNEVATASQANSRVTASSAASTALVLADFAGPVDQNPADPSIAVGPNHIVATVNSKLVIYDKTGRQMSSTPLIDFMTGTHDVSNDIWDTYPIYDQVSGRYYIVSAWGAQGAHGGAFLAVSATSDPTGQWHTYLLDSSTQTWVDFPKVGITQNAVVLSFDEVPTTGSTARGACPALVVGLPGLLSGSSSLSITRFDAVFGSPGECSPAFPVFNYDGGALTYLVELNTPTGTGNSLALAKLDTSATPALTKSTVSVPAYAAAVFAAQLNGKTQINVGSPRIDSAVLRNGSLWCTHTVASPDGTAAVRWYQLDPAGPTLQQSGNISGVGNAFMGAIAVNASNDADLVFTTSSTSQFASAGYAHRSATDPPNTMPLSAVYQPGASAYGGTRWGDYFTAVVDPTDQNVWGIAEYWGAKNYGTQIVELAASSGTPAPGPGPGAPALAISVNPASATVKAGSSASLALGVTAQNTTAPVALSCSGLPQGDTCTFAPATLNGSGASTLTIATKSTSAALLPGQSIWLGLGAMLGLVWLVPGIRRNACLRAMLLVAVIALGLGACGGAGGSSPTPPPAPPQTLSVTVTATSGTVRASTVVALTVQ